MIDDRLTLLANEVGDLPIMSALMQDSIIGTGDVAWDRRGRRLVLLASRYRWENTAKTRVRSAFRIESVVSVQRRNWPRGGDTILVVLAIIADASHVEITFAGSISLRAEVECLDAVLEDMSPAWVVDLIPEHD